MDSTVRHPAVAGRFYPRDRDTLLEDVHVVSVARSGNQTSPRMRGAACRLHLLRSCRWSRFRQTGHSAALIVLCPNHTGKGRPLAIMSSGAWETPLGSVPIDAPLAAALKNKFPQLTEDENAHRSEHAIEVELPFLQARRPDLTFVPIALGTGQFDVLEKLGEAIAEQCSRRMRKY